MTHLYTDTLRAIKSIEDERDRQEQLKAAGRFKFSCADLEMTNPERLAVLAEEFGEAAHEVNETIGGHAVLNRANLRKELVQVAAVACAWIEALDKEGT